MERMAHFLPVPTSRKVGAAGIEGQQIFSGKIEMVISIGAQPHPRNGMAPCTGPFAQSHLYLYVN
jgi:hypothetical protein